MYAIRSYYGAVRGVYHRSIIIPAHQATRHANFPLWFNGSVNIMNYGIVLQNQERVVYLVSYRNNFV